MKCRQCKINMEPTNAGWMCEVCGEIIKYKHKEPRGNKKHKEEPNDDNQRIN